MADVGQTVIPKHARDAWLKLAGVLAATGPAPCERGDADAWWPPAGRNPSPAVAACGGCGTRVECLRYALAAGERRGVWGGMTAAERRQLARATA